jgi:hypothetical protein
MDDAPAIIRPALNADGGDDLEDRFLDKFALFIGFIAFDLIRSHVLKWLGASLACQSSDQQWVHSCEERIASYVQESV